MATVALASNLGPQEARMSGEEWITKAQWQKLLRLSRDLLDRIDSRKRKGLPVVHLWNQLRPINQRIRSDTLKVIGIDDRHHLKEQQQ